MTKQKTGADLESIGAPKDTATITLFHPVSGDELRDGEGSPMYVEVYGQDSDVFRKIDRAIANRNIQKARKSRNSSLTADQMESQRLERIVKCVRSWNLVIGGQSPECDESTVREVMEKYDWLRDQAEEGIYDRANFLSS